MLKHLWATPVAVFDVRDDFKDFDRANEAMIRAFPQRTHERNLFSFRERPVEFDELRVVVRKRVAQFSQESGLREELVFFDGFFNEYKRGDVNTPHAHPLTMVVAIYYARALGTGHGDVFLQDPRAGMNWIDVVDEDTRGASGYRVYERITPKTGDLLVFPAYVVHSVEANKLDGPSRMSIGINCYSRKFLRHFNPGI